LTFKEEEEEEEEEEELEEDATDRIRNELNDVYDDNTNKLAAVTVSLPDNYTDLN
jgi:adenylate/nucleoside-diphosphate kinase